MNNLLINSYDEYVDHMKNTIENYENLIGHEVRRKQIWDFINSFQDNFTEIKTLELGSSSNYNDGLFGVFLGIYTSKKGGKMISVDIDCDVVNQSKKIFNEVIPKLNYECYCMDSVKFISETEFIPNLVHIDSLDFNLFDIMPSALKGWEEFKAIESKMESGSIIIIDDNYRGGTYLQWFHSNGDEDCDIIKYPMVGKGAHVFQEVLKGNTNWKLIGNHYNDFHNLKIIIQKK